MKKNKLISKAREIRNAYLTPSRVAKDMQGCVIWFTASSAECRAVYMDDPSQLFVLSPLAGDHYKKLDFKWTVCRVVLDRDIVNNRFNQDVTIYNTLGKYEDVADFAYNESIDELDKMNKKRRKNIAMFFCVGHDVDFSEEVIDRLLSADKEFYQSEGLITQQDKTKELEQQIKLLEAV